MTINPTLAARAYATAQRDIANAAGNDGASEKPGGAFGRMLESALNDTLKAGDAANSAIISQAAGRADVVDVVTAVAEAEVTLKTLVNVRDRVIASYQDIMKMPI